RQSENDVRSRSGHSPPFEDLKTDEPRSEAAPETADPSGLRPQSNSPGSLPLLREPEDAELTFPGVHRQTNAEKVEKPARVEHLGTKRLGTPPTVQRVQLALA